MIPMRRSIARKQHRCTPYFAHFCAGTGRIEKGLNYWSPLNDCIDPFHPYRICYECMMRELVAHPQCWPNIKTPQDLAEAHADAPRKARFISIKK